MKRILGAALFGLAICHPAAAQMPNPQQFLQGLTTGNQNQDQALRDAFERGYQRGRQDEARLRSDRGPNDRTGRRGSDDLDSGSNRQNQAPSQGYSR